MNKLQKWYGQHAHPVAFIFHIIGGMWAVYFLWQRNWILALIFVMILPAIGGIYAIQDEKGKKIPLTPLRKLLIGHARPLSGLFQIPGYVSVIYGLWIHSTIYILLSISFFLLGELFALRKINKGGEK